uniref:Protein ENHANCED DISEASE RESISTANCE 2 C-terminal domain-containing protein n=1 Tax=Craspedostauros australis TaxID=1486917 RepID=A0A7R9WXB0_9STRA
MGSPSVLRSRSQERSVRKFSETMENGMQLMDAFEDTERIDDELATQENNEDSERCAEAGKNKKRSDRRGHRRAMSDPFDTAESGGITDADLAHVLAEPSEDDDDDDAALPTMPRFPVAETRDTNCWSEPSVSIFRVRGPNYLHDKKKIQSGNYLLRARGCDLFLSDDPQKCIIGENIKGVLGGSLRKAPSFLVRFTFPWGVLVQYFEVPAKLADFMDPNKAVETSMNDFSPAEATLAKWLAGDDAYKNERLKLIPYVAEGPWIVRQMVTGKPAIIGKKLPIKYSYMPGTGASQAGFLVADLDIGNSSSTAKRIVSVCRRYMSSLTVDIGFVIQANEPEELPEQMMGSIRIHRADPIKAVTIG